MVRQIMAKGVLALCVSFWSASGGGISVQCARNERMNEYIVDWRPCRLRILLIVFAARALKVLTLQTD